MDLTRPSHTHCLTNKGSTELDLTQQEQPSHNSKNNKRPPSPTTPETPNTPDQNIQQVDFIIPNKHKRNKLSNEKPTFEEQMEPIQKFLDDSGSQFTFNFNQISSFLRNSFGSNDPVSIAQEFTNDIPGLLEMLSSIYPHYAHRSLKNRITRIQRKIRTQLNIPQLTQPTSTDSDSSLSDFNSTL